MLYNSPSFIVVQFDVQVDEPVPGELLKANPELQLHRGGFEIVDKFTRKEIFIEGALAKAFQDGVEALMETSPSEEDIDDFVEGYARMGHQPVVMH
ncbi:DUF3567 domain-containing protein [Pelomonas sp. KK5]|uniref:BTH_I0359 family protein n=1 Tax=Pelomonas sp. KK5 TaxID=1855730 RepID=UPI001E43D806|nr:DUF3567 domain-containing protein [Pelomonas sp. KK5]